MTRPTILTVCLSVLQIGRKISDHADSIQLCVSSNMKPVRKWNFGAVILQLYVKLCINSDGFEYTRKFSFLIEFEVIINDAIVVFSRLKPRWCMFLA